MSVCLNNLFRCGGTGRPTWLLTRRSNASAGSKPAIGAKQQRVARRHTIAIAGGQVVNGWSSKPAQASSNLVARSTFNSWVLSSIGRALVSKTRGWGFEALSARHMFPHTPHWRVDPVHALVAQLAAQSPCKG